MHGFTRQISQHKLFAPLPGMWFTWVNQHYKVIEQFECLNKTTLDFYKYAKNKEDYRFTIDSYKNHVVFYYRVMSVSINPEHVAMNAALLKLMIEQRLEHLIEIGTINGGELWLTSYGEYHIGSINKKGIWDWSFKIELIADNHVESLCTLLHKLYETYP